MSKRNEENRVILTTQIAAVLAICATPYIFIFWKLNLEIQYLMNICLVSTLLFSIILNKIGLHKIAKFSIILIVDFGLLFYATSLGKPAGIQLVFFALISVPFVIFDPKEKKSVLLGFALPVFSMFYLEYAHYKLFSRVIIEQNYLQAIYLTINFVTFFIISISIYFYYKAHQKSEESLKNSNKKLEMTNIKLDKALLITEDVISAGKMQGSLQPKEKPKHVQMAFKNYAARHMAGDFGFWKDIGQNNEKTFITIGDVQGKGAGPGFAAGILVDRLTHFVTDHSNSISLTDVDHFFLNRIANTPPLQKKAVAAIAFLIDFYKKEFSYLNAGFHSEPILHRKTGDKEILNCASMAYGFADDPCPIKTFQFQKGDRIVASSDGLEDIQNENKERFGPENAEQLLAEACQLPFDDILPHIENRIMSFKGQAEFADDITILIIEF